MSDLNYSDGEDNEYLNFITRCKRDILKQWQERIEEASALRPGPKITCDCGECKKCRKREWQRHYRAGRRIRLPYSTKRKG